MILRQRQQNLPQNRQRHVDVSVDVNVKMRVVVNARVILNTVCPVNVFVMRISTQKLHARGPMGLEALTSYKYIIYGNGQIRP